MKRSKYKIVWIILGVILIISMAREFGRMAGETSLAEAALGIFVFTLMVIGIVFWIRKSRGGKDRIRKL